MFDTYDIDLLLTKIRLADTTQWIGTHCYLKIQDCDLFDCIINVTVTTYRSKLYRWLRAYHHYYSKSSEYQNLQDMQLIDKQRETAKNYLRPFLPVDHSKVINLEFADVVEGGTSFQKLAGADWVKHHCRWKDCNSFLYENVWQDTLSARLYEAEYELAHKSFYQYE